MLILGTIVSVAALELEALTGFLHYALYFGVTFVLAWLAGTHLAAPISGEYAPDEQQQVAPATPGSEPGDDPGSPADNDSHPADQVQQEVPKLLQ